MRSRAWSRCGFFIAPLGAHKAAQSGRVGDRSMNENRFETTTSRPKPAGARWNASTAPGPGGALVRRCATGFEDAHRCRKCAFLGNPDDSFEDAHPFPRCAQESCASSHNRPPRSSSPSSDSARSRSLRLFDSFRWGSPKSMATTSGGHQFRLDRPLVRVRRYNRASCQTAKPLPGNSPTTCQSPTQLTPPARQKCS